MVDEALWVWRGERWAHLCSDRDLDELHRFARHLGLRRLSFQGDHYDVTAADRARALAAGAEPVPSRLLLRRLRAAGLRQRGGRGLWSWTLQLQRGGRPEPEWLAALHRVGSGLGLSEASLGGCTALVELDAPVELRLLSRPVELALVVVGPRLEPLLSVPWPGAELVAHPRVTWPPSGAPRDGDDRFAPIDPRGRAQRERAMLEVFIARPSSADD